MYQIGSNIFLSMCALVTLVSITHVFSLESSDKLEANVKQLKDWDYGSMLKYFEGSVQSAVEKDVAKMISLVENKQFSEIDDSFSAWFNQAYEQFASIKNYLDTGYTYNEKENQWEKSVTEPNTKTETKSTLSTETMEKLEEQVRKMKEIKYSNLLKYINPGDREKVTSDVEKIITLIENKQFGDIDDNTAQWFTKVVEQIHEIDKYLRDGYIYDEKTNTWIKNIIDTEPSLNEKTIDELENMGNELEKWNYREIANNLEEPDREKVDPVVTKMRMLLENKKHTEINPELVTEFQRIYKLIREARPISNKKIIKTVTEIDNIDWEKILSEIEGVDKNVWRKRIRLVIRQVKTRPQSRIQYPWLKEMRRIVRVIRKQARPISKVKMHRFLRRWRHVVGTNWRVGLRQIRGINHRLWERRFRKVIHHMKYYPNRRMTFPWIRKFFRIVRVMHTRNVPVHPVRPLRRIRPIYVVRQPRRFHRTRRVLPFHQIRQGFRRCH